MANKTTRQTLELPISQRHILDSSALATSSACVLGINLDNLPTNFVGQHLDKVTPTCIANASCEIMIMNHIPNLQFFNRNDFELFDNLQRDFVEKILPLIENSFVKPCNLNYCFSPISRAFFLPAQSSLKSGKFLLAFNQEFGIFNFSSIRQDSKTLNSNIYAYVIIGNFNLYNRNILSRENSKPANSSSFDSESLEFASWNSVNDNRDVSNFTYENSLIRNEPETTLRKSYGLVAIKSFEAGKSCLAFFLLDPSEEMLKSIINPLAYVLQYLAMDRNIKIFCEFVQVELGKIGFAGEENVFLKEEGDILQVLRTFGYSYSEARDAIKQLSPKMTGTQNRVKEALKILGTS